MRAAIFARNHENLHPILITNYGCGPDAFFMKYLEDTMNENPYMALELDEHSGDAGITTRLEAFVDTARKARTVSHSDEQTNLEIVRPESERVSFQPSRTIRLRWIF